MRLRRIARPLARKGLSVIVAFLLSQFANFRWDLERRVTPVEIAADRNRSIVSVETQKRRSRPSSATIMFSCKAILAATLCFPLCPRKRTSDVRAGMSVSCQERKSGLFNNLIGGGKQRGWHSEAERLGGLEVDGHLKPGRLHDWKVGWFGSVEDAADIDSDLEQRIATDRRVADQTAGSGKFGPLVHDGHLVAGRQRHQLVSAYLKEQISAHQQRIRSSLSERRKCLIDFTVAARIQDNDVPPDRAGSILDLTNLHFTNLTARVHEKSNQARLGNQLAQQVKPLRPERGGEHVEARDIATWPIVALDQAILNRIATAHENDRNCGRCRLRRPRRLWSASRDDHIDLAAYQLIR